MTTNASRSCAYLHCGHAFDLHIPQALWSSPSIPPTPPHPTPIPSGRMQTASGSHGSNKALLCRTVSYAYRCCLEESMCRYGCLSNVSLQRCCYQQWHQANIQCRSQVSAPLEPVIRQSVGHLSSLLLVHITRSQLCRVILPSPARAGPPSGSRVCCTSESIQGVPCNQCSGSLLCPFLHECPPSCRMGNCGSRCCTIHCCCAGQIGTEVFIQTDTSQQGSTTPVKMHSAATAMATIVVQPPMQTCRQLGMSRQWTQLPAAVQAAAAAAAVQAAAVGC